MSVKIPPDLSPRVRQVVENVVSTLSEGIEARVSGDWAAEHVNRMSFEYRIPNETDRLQEAADRIIASNTRSVYRYLSGSSTVREALRAALMDVGMGCPAIDPKDAEQLSTYLAKRVNTLDTEGVLGTLGLSDSADVRSLQGRIPQTGEVAAQNIFNESAVLMVVDAARHYLTES